MGDIKMNNIIKRNIENHINDYQNVINPCPKS